jgi:hypothetical protein
MLDLPSINIIKDLIGARFVMRNDEIFANPGNEMILECSLDELM